MESALAGLIMMTVALFAALTLGQTYLATQDSFLVARQEMETRILQRAGTEIEVVDVQAQSSGSIIQVTLRNSGNVKLADFDRWDVIVEYYRATEELQIVWLPYTSGTLNQNQWTDAGIYMDAGTLAAEAFDQEIWNPGEEMVLRAHVHPPVGPDTTNRLTLAAPNGMSLSTFFTR